MKGRALSIIGLLFVFAISSFAEPASVCNFLLIPSDTNGLRSDTINVLNYDITLNITDFTTDTLRGNTVVRFTPKMNGIKTLSLDLLHMTVDSIDISKKQVPYSYNDTLIILKLPATENIGDTNNVTVYYHGKPVIDPSGWGGFYFSGKYAFNLGVGFEVIPHNFGRAWFPCFDNFIAKSTFAFHITTDTANLSFCNGYLTKDSVSGSTRTRTWVMPYPISSYHASVDVAPYVTMQDTFRGIDTIPIVVASLPADTANIRKSFIHLKNAIAIYQNCYGKYEWNKVGYSMVSFSGGAMEHATNIAFPVLAANGTTDYEANIMAHELSHHWCGDLVTCRSAEDMWLNEGFAVFNQSVFLEYVYGDSVYHTYTRQNHDNVIHYCAIADHGYWPLSGMPQTYTYGNLNYWVSTTYQKGADVFHTLRSYLGDSAFFNGMKYYFSSHKYQPVTADTLKNSLERYTGYNLTDFFNDWVFAPGFPQFSIDSTVAVASGPNYNVTVYVKQKLMGAPSYYTNVPMEVTFKAGNWTTYTQTILMSGHLSNYNFTVPFKPVFTALNMKDKIGEAISPDTLIVKKAGTYNMSNSRVDLTVSSINDSAFLFLENNYAAPDPVKDTSLHYRISPYRYWKISGIIPANFSATAKLYYDGRRGGSPTNGTYYLDTALMMKTRDSLILLYRPSAAYDWKEFPAYTKHNIGSATTMYGYMQLDSVPPGEYTFANGVSKVLGIKQLGIMNSELRIFPDPASGEFTIEVSPSRSKQYVSVYDIRGKMIKHETLSPGQKNCIVKTSEWESGTYIVSLFSGSKKVATRQIVITH